MLPCIESIIVVVVGATAVVVATAAVVDTSVVIVETNRFIRTIE